MDHIGNHIERHELFENWQHQCSKPEHKLKAQETFDIFPNIASSDDESGDDETDDESPHDGNECATSNEHNLPDLDLDFNFDFHDQSTATTVAGWENQRFSAATRSPPQLPTSTLQPIISGTSQKQQSSKPRNRSVRRRFARWLQREFRQEIPWTVHRRSHEDSEMMEMIYRAEQLNL